MWGIYISFYKYCNLSTLPILLKRFCIPWTNYTFCEPTRQSMFFQKTYLVPLIPQSFTTLSEAIFEYEQISLEIQPFTASNLQFLRLSTCGTRNFPDLASMRLHQLRLVSCCECVTHLLLVVDLDDPKRHSKSSNLNFYIKKLRVPHMLYIAVQLTPFQSNFQGYNQIIQGVKVVASRCVQNMITTTEKNKYTTWKGSMPSHSH